MPEYLIPLIAGIVGTVAMTIFLIVPRFMNVENVDIIRAVGALWTKREDNAWAPGFVIHFGSGIAFAYIYWFLFGLAGLPLNTGTGVLAGAVHGALVMLFTSIAVMEHHPIRKYQKRGPMTGFMQLLAHVLYGLIVGAIVHALALPVA